MRLDIQYRIKSNPMYLQFLRENCKYYKILTRSPDLFNEFERNAKERFKLRTVDRLEKVVSTIELINSLVSTLK